MNKIQRQITEYAQCDVLDATIKTLKGIKTDLTKRLKSQEKTLANWKENWDGKEIVESGIVKMKRTLNVIEYLQHDNENDSRSVTERLAVKGYVVTDRKQFGHDNGCRMIVDKDGNDVGYLTPLHALRQLGC